MAGLHDEGGGAAGEVAQFAGVAEQLGQRNVGVEHAAALLQGGVEDFAAATTDVARQVAQVLAGGVDDDVHDRLQEGDARLHLSVAEVFHGGQLERVLRTIDIVVLAVRQRYFDVYARE